MQAGLVRPPRGRGHVTLGQQQPRPLRRNRVEQASRRSGEACLASPIASRAPAGSPVACRIHASVTRPAASDVLVEKLAVKRDALGDIPQRAVELVPLVGHFGQAHVHEADGRRWRPAGHCGDSSACW